MLSQFSDHKPSNNFPSDFFNNICSSFTSNVACKTNIQKTKQIVVFFQYPDRILCYHFNATFVLEMKMGQIWYSSLDIELGHVWCPLKTHTHLNKPATLCFRFVKICMVLWTLGVKGIKDCSLVKERESLQKISSFTYFQFYLLLSKVLLFFQKV